MTADAFLLYTEFHSAPGFLQKCKGDRPSKMQGAQGALAVKQFLPIEYETKTRFF